MGGITANRRAIKLYRGLLRYGKQNVVLSDRAYYNRYMREQMEKYAGEQVPVNLIVRRIQKGQELLKNGMGGLM